MSWRELAGRPWGKPYTYKREAAASQSRRLSRPEEPMLGSQNLRDLESSSALLAYDFLCTPQPLDVSCFSRQLMSTSNCTLFPNRSSPSNSIPPSEWTSQQRVEFNWLIYQDLCARRLYYNQLHSTPTVSAMREVGDTTSEGFVRLAPEQDMELPENLRPNEDETSLLISQETNKCSVPGVPAALSKHREQLGLPTETSKLLKDILQHKDRALRENNNSLKGLMVNGREGQDNTDLIAQLLKNNTSHSHTALMDERDRDSLRVSVQGDSESDSDRDSYTDTCRFNGDEELGETDTMDSDMKGETVGEKRNSDHFDQDACGPTVKDGDSVEAKRARVENIITSMRPSPSGIGADMGAQLSPDMRRPKRKQYQPQQHDSKYAPHSANKYRKQEERNKLKEQLHFVQKTLQQMQKQYLDLFDEEEKDSADFSLRSNKDSKYLDILSDKLCSKKEDSTHCRNLTFSPTSLDASSLLKETSRPILSHDISPSSRNTQNLDKDGLKDFASLLKFEIADAVGSAIDGVVTKFLSPVTKPKGTDIQNNVNSQNVEKENKPLRISPKPSEVVPKTPDFTEVHRKEFHSSTRPHKISEKSDRPEKHDRFDHKTSFLDSPLRGFMDLPRHHHSLPQLPPYPGMPFYMPTQIHAPTPLMFGVEPEQTEALPLVVNTPKKKRTKVTDTRLSPRAARVLLQETVPLSSQSDLTMGHNSPSAYPHLFPHLLPTSVAIPNPSLQHSDIMRFYEEQVYNHHHDTTPQSSTHSPLHADQGSPGASHISASEGAHLSNGKRERDSYSPGDGSYDSFHLTITLTPMHLRKAKLMFFFVRYPSSAILKMYFPDIKFNKNNTAQLVKWFSNFREFYYIQMEKYSRQAIAEGVKNGEDLIVTTDSELYRILNLHYNRNNQLEVPESFRMVVQATLREFFKSIYATKDQEQSWKKSIYKVIARMDDILPEYFKSPNWMEQLGEM